MNNLKRRVLLQNRRLINLDLVVDSFGNASGHINSKLYIKPSGIDLEKTRVGDISEIELESGLLKSGKKPSSDTPTHLELYRKFPDIGGVVHTHSPFATAWAQSCKSIPCLGTTHADYWNGEIPITRDLTKDEINGEYEKETGKVIIEKINELNIAPLDCPGILVAGHGPFTWGKTVEKAVKHAELLEYIARLAWLSLSINPGVSSISKDLLNKHFSRKHGPDAYYGQDTE